MFLFIVKSPDYLKHCVHTVALLASEGYRVAICFEFFNFKDPLHRGSIKNLTKLAANCQGNLTICFEAVGSAHLKLSITIVESLYRDLLLSRSILREQNHEYGTSFTYLSLRDRLKSLIGYLCRLCAFQFASRVLCNYVGIALNRRLSRQGVNSRNIDLMILIPYVFPGSFQQLISLSKQRCLPLIGSWDNLSTKGYIYGKPKRIALWSQFQESELRLIHSLDTNSMFVGSQNLYDSRKKFLKHTSEEVPLRFGSILFLGSSISASPDEYRILTILADFYSKDYEFIYRPHPRIPQEQLDRIKISLPNIKIDLSYTFGEADAEGCNGFFNALSRAHIVIGVNTTALIQACLFGKKTYIPFLPGLVAHTHVYHFRYLQYLINEKCIHRLTELRDIKYLTDVCNNIIECEEFCFGTSLSTQTPAERLKSAILQSIS